MIKNEGHEIGNHGYKHLDYSTLSYDENLEQKEQKDIPIPFKIGYDVPEILINNESSNPLYEVSFIIYNTNK